MRRMEKCHECQTIKRNNFENNLHQFDISLTHKQIFFYIYADHSQFKKKINNNNKNNDKKNNIQVGEKVMYA